MHKLKLSLEGAALAALLLLANPAAASTPDAWITAKTKLSILTAKGVSATDVNVDTVNGRVTLHGKVATDAEKAKAEDVARKIDGVKDVHNLLQVVPKSAEKAVEKSDDQIKKDVENALKAEPAVQSSSISVASVNKGVVLLSGSADTMTAHLYAVDAARAVPGVVEVASEVKGPETMADSEVWREETTIDTDTASKPEPSTAHKAEASVKEGAHKAEAGIKEGGRAAGRTVKDAWITSDLKARLISADDVPALDINVDTHRGIVTLFGIVPSVSSKAKAEAEARKVDGVKDVKNELQVVAKSQKEAVKDADDVIEKHAKEAIKSREDADDVSVEVKNGVARLTGHIASRSDALHVAQVVREVPGVRSVANDLRLSGEVASKGKMGKH